MSKIRILPEQLANQIAAGEVVERPASVVKELVENSLDAGANRIEIEIESGGTRLIRVIDNGEGMDEDDILLSIERHGTSKIAAEKDLLAITTLGFRGEAIPSIGSVSRLTIISRPRGKELGTRVLVNYGKLLEVIECGSRYGSSFEVRNLFGKTPARRKFLKTQRTELAHIDETVKNYALCSPDITFILRINDRETLHLSNTLSPRQRLSRIINYRGDFLEIDYCQGHSHVQGFLVPPDRLSTGPSKLRVFVNNRAIRDRMVVHGAAEGLRSFLMKGKNPAGFIHLTLPAEEVDVNVHPAKQEVRFRHSADVHKMISDGVAIAMEKEQNRLRARVFGGERRNDPTRIPFEAEERKIPESRESFHMESLPFTRVEKVNGHEPDIPPREGSLITTSEPVPNQQFPDEKTPADNGATPGNDGHNLRIIGQYDDLFIFCKNREGLLVIDQHAAHERLLYEKLKNQYMANRIARQNLLFPETVELSPAQIQLVEKHGEQIEKMGFSIREFGGNSYIISAVPAFAVSINPAALFNDILEQFGGEEKGGGLVDTILATMACKAAVKAGTELSEPEIKNLLDEMAAANLFSHCPHGRPVVKQFSTSEVKKWFHRT
ncbi:DNA mismatch repair endonuclease MutL [Desulfomarina sp.]